MEAGNIFWEEVVLALYAEGNYTHATYLPLFFEAKLMSPERHSRASYSMDRHPQHLSSVQRRKHITAVQLQTRGKAQSRAWICINLMFIQSHHCTLSACKLPVSEAAALEGFVIKCVVQGHCTLSLQDSSALTVFPLHRYIALSIAIIVTFYKRNVGTWKIWRSSWRMQICYLLPLSNTAMNFLGKTLQPS